MSKLNAYTSISSSIFFSILKTNRHSSNKQSPHAAVRSCEMWRKKEGRYAVIKTRRRSREKSSSAICVKMGSLSRSITEILSSCFNTKLSMPKGKGSSLMTSWPMEWLSLNAFVPWHSAAWAPAQMHCTWWSINENRVVEARHYFGKSGTRIVSRKILFLKILQPKERCRKTGTPKSSPQSKDLSDRGLGHILNVQQNKKPRSQDLQCLKIYSGHNGLSLPSKPIQAHDGVLFGAHPSKVLYDAPQALINFHG